MSEMVNITIDGKTVAVPKGTTVYHACKDLGIDIPIFCYHDRMPPFGACRMCLVEVEKMPKLQTSCTLQAIEGMVVKTQSDAAVNGRKGILEFLLINHPLDCPICDKGGECPLQDQALKFGPGESRFYEEKRHFPKRIPLGPVLVIDRERCVVCARCTRFGSEVAGDSALQFQERGFKTIVGTPEDGPAVSKFIGNTIEMCPVGALTSQVYRFQSRPWDNNTTSSVCTLCPVGCSMKLDERDGELMRTRPEEDLKVNDVWLCDKGSFGYEFVTDPDRLQAPLIRRGAVLEPASWDEALDLIASKMKQAIPEKKIAGFGGNPLTTEENHLFQKLIREVAKADHVDHRIGMLSSGSQGMELSFDQVEKLSYAYLLGFDVTEEFPLLWLRLKQAINKGAKVIFIGHFAPEIAPHLHQVILHAPGKELETIKQHLAPLSGVGALFVGSQYLGSSLRDPILEELASSSISLNVMEGRGNSRGAMLAGMQGGLSALEILETKTGWDFLMVAGSNPAAKVPSRLWSAFREKLDFLVVQDLFLTETAASADVVLPTLSAFEKEGSFINVEGRVRKIHPGKKIPEGIYSDGEIFQRIASKLGVNLQVDPAFIKLLQQEKVTIPKKVSIKSPPQQPSKDQLAATFAYSLFDEGVRMRHNPHLAENVKEPSVRIHPLDGNKRGIQDGQKGKIEFNGQKITAQIAWDEKVAEGAIVLPIGFANIPVHELAPNLQNGMYLQVTHVE
jgi:NADH-quinone oxidoreductase subunit G